MRARDCLTMLAFAAAACDQSPALESDPARWSPLEKSAPLPVADAAGTDAGSFVPAACRGTPPYAPDLETSLAGAFSHRPGQPCLEACHEAGGVARLTFAAAGTVYEAQLSRVLATSGEVQDIGGTALTVDACGNFYATPSTLVSPAGSTQPYVRSPTLRRMDRQLTGQERPGSCNQSGCHDLSTRLRWGVYF